MQLRSQICADEAARSPIFSAMHYRIKKFRAQPDGTLEPSSDIYLVEMTLEEVRANAQQHLRVYAGEFDVVHVESRGQRIYEWSLPAKA